MNYQFKENIVLFIFFIIPAISLCDIAGITIKAPYGGLIRRSWVRVMCP